MARFWPRRPAPISEATTTTAPASVAPAGFTYGIPRGGTTEYNQGIAGNSGNDRRNLLEELYQAYLTCPWSSACVDTIARTITAGGLDIVWDGEEEDVPDAPPEVVALRDLLGFVNPTEDIRQLMRGVLSDLLVFGDAFLEVLWLGTHPIALFSLDVPSMAVIADEHGTVTSYVQITESGQRAEFEPRDVIHFSLDTPRSGLLGVSPTQKALLPITVWLFTAATLKEVMRKGDPPNLHIDFPGETSDTEIDRWRAKYMTRNTGARNIGNPVTTKGGAAVNELKAYVVQQYLETLNQKRDEILSTYGVPPSKVGVIESGNLGGGTGTSQDKTFRVNTCGPTGEAVLEKLIFHLMRVAFGISDEWTMRFGDIDWRDDKTVDEISSQRLRDGRWTLNRARAEIGEGPVEGGDDPVLALSREIVVWADMAAYSKAAVASNGPKSGGPGSGSVPPGVAAPDDGAGDGGAKEASPSPAEQRAAWQEAYARQLRAVRAELVEAGRG